VTPQLEKVAEDLLAGTREGERVSIDRIGDALGSLAAGSSEVEWIFARLEAAGRIVGADQGGRGEANLRVVLAEARAYRQREGKIPTRRDLATATGLTEKDVTYALALAKVMQR
jgi:hypothetical protein